jgi:hypothetical protein
VRKKFDYLDQLVYYKARLIIKGFEKYYNINYFETFASMLQYNILRALLTKAVVEDLEIDQMDIDIAFLNSTLEEIYIKIPQFFELLYFNIDFKGKCLQLL